MKNFVCRKRGLHTDFYVARLKRWRRRKRRKNLMHKLFRRKDEKRFFFLRLSFFFFFFFHIDFFASRYFCFILLRIGQRARRNVLIKNLVNQFKKTFWPHSWLSLWFSLFFLLSLGYISYSLFVTYPQTVTQNNL